MMSQQAPTKQWAEHKTTAINEEKMAKAKSN
jgi:Fe-S cluster biosynthesis and repair protein YggX